MNLSHLPVIDNHCHPLAPEKATLSPQSLAREFYHGQGDVLDPAAANAKATLSAARLADITQLGVVHTLVNQLARVFGCAPDLATVAEERNRLTGEGLAAYAQMLYQDAHIVATVVDSDLAPGAPGLALIPGRVMRLFQMGPAMDRLLAASGSFGELVAAYERMLTRAVRDDGFVGVKCHLAEVVGFGTPLATAEEGQAALGAAKAGHAPAYQRLYTAMFATTLRICQALDVPVHLHSGITGGIWNGPISNADPFLLAPILSQPAFRASKIVLLHAGYPWIEQAALMAHAFPQVWVDISWVTPWTSLRAVECMRAFMATAPLSRLMIGSGGHGTPEVAWLGAIVAKIALSSVLDEAVSLGLMAGTAAESTAAMVLHDNAARLYGLGRPA